MNINLALGMLWLLWFITNYFSSEGTDWHDYGLGLFSMIYFGLYLYQRQNKYLTISDGWIKKNSPFGKKIKLGEVDRIRKFAGDYILKTDSKEFVINTLIIAPESIKDLDGELQKLDVTWY
ncbi:hypothetical protein [Allomuricauda sp.]|uniref:hypothetical protein n=1 Tax=Flagellimonas alginolytica TaxID=3177515 RepID=UPI0025F8DBEA|nr:hypothetical protein [Allomuricauda sp.]